MTSCAGVTEGVRDAVAVALTVRLPVMVGVMERLCVTVGDAVRVRVGVTAAVGVQLPVRLSVGVQLAVRLSVGVQLADRVRVGVTVPVGELEGVRVGVTVAVLDGGTYPAHTCGAVAVNTYVHVGPSDTPVRANAPAPQVTVILDCRATAPGQPVVRPFVM